MDVPSFLKQLDLEAFETAFNDCGYDSVDTLSELTLGRTSSPSSRTHRHVLRAK